MISTNIDFSVFGLEPRDIVVYEALLSLEDATSIRKIAELTRQNRGTTFEIIKKLTQNGLVTSHFKNKRKYYVANPPSELRRYAEAKQQVVAEQLPRIDAYIQQLSSKAAFDDNHQFTQFYDGEEEIAALLRDVLDTLSKSEKKEYHVISSAEIRNHLYNKFRTFTRQRIKRQIFANVIAIGGEDGPLAELADRRWLSSDQIPACYIIIYGDKVAQISLSDFGIVQGIVVQNKGLAQLHRLMFEQLWAGLAG